MIAVSRGSTVSGGVRLPSLPAAGSSIDCDTVSGYMSLGCAACPADVDFDSVSGSLTLTFFNQPYAARQLTVGESYVFCGRLEVNGTRRGMTNPVFEPEGKNQLTGRIVPVYALTAGISPRQLSACLISVRNVEKYTQLHKIKSISSGVFGMNDFEPKIPEFLRQSVTRVDFGFY